MTDKSKAQEARREDHESTTVEAAARFERDQNPDPVRISGQPHDPDDVPRRDEL